MRELTYKIAETFVFNFTEFNKPGSISYADHTAGAWLLDQVQRYGFSTTAKMNTACRAFMCTHKPAPVVKKQKLHIEVVKFMGKHGAFASGESVLYKTELVGVNGKRENINDWQNEGYGYSESRYATSDAAKWAALLGCPVVSVDTIGKGE